MSSAADFGELDKPQTHIPQIPQIADTGWRWEKKGSGNYRGNYYNWRWGSGKYRKYRNGGKLAEVIAFLPQRPGKGNRKPRRPDSDIPTISAELAAIGNAA